LLALRYADFELIGLMLAFVILLSLCQRPQLHVPLGFQ
jgi:hypothetical protein